MDIAKYVGSKIKYYRNKKRITQQELGEYLNTTSQTISRYESGILEIGHNTLFRLADYFDVSIDDFFPPMEKKEIPEEQDEVYKQILRDKGLMDENDNINEEDFKKLIDFAVANKDFIINKKDKD